LNLKKFVDTDHDGFDDTLEKKIFHDLAQTSDGDFENDGFNNLMEYTSLTGHQSTNEQEDIILKAIKWLESSQNSDGSWGTYLKPLHTSEVVIALKSVNQSSSAALSA